MTRPPALGSISTRQRQLAERARVIDEPLRSVATQMDIAWMHEAYRLTRKSGATGIDGQTADEFAADLDANLDELLELAKSGRYRAPAVRRVEIPKGGGKTRPIGIPTFRDKVLQRAVKELLEPIYEQSFHDFSYGFRPGRSALDGVKALKKCIDDMHGGWVLEVDIKSFFDEIDKQKLRDILRTRVADGVIVRLVGKWLNAGVLEGGVVTRSDRGTPQGGVISPLLANIYLHTVLDQWWVETMQPRIKGKSGLVRYADDFVIVFRRKRDAERVKAALSERFAEYGLRLHPDKTRLVHFHRPRPDDEDDGNRGSFDFLGFRYRWHRSRKNGWWSLSLETARSRLNRTLKAMNAWLKRNRHLPIAAQRAMLEAKLKGHYGYFGALGYNLHALGAVYHHTRRLWRKWLGRRSQRGTLTDGQWYPLLRRYSLPLPPRWSRKPRRQQRELAFV